MWMRISALKRGWLRWMWCLRRGAGSRLAGDGEDDLFALLNEAVVSSNDGEGNDEGDAEADSSAAVGVDLVVDSLWVDRSELIQEGVVYAMGAAAQSGRGGVRFDGGGLLPVE